ncbi:MFS transporter [Glaciihabitans sp. dw_435]|uniref:MFS transporter n=1 Tax=Glaciihabitans sp. dw_435 TaxID=2720081 RepID=UPI001BD6660A|nr:MFS transporter [Glaciihabitans sp. dw_435]
MSTISASREPGSWYIATVSGMASYIDSASIISFGTAVVIYQTALGLTPAQVGIASGVLTFSIAIGAVVGGRLGDRYGRRPVFTVTMILIALGAVSAVLATAFPMLLVGAILIGVGTGADLPVSLATIAEAADDSNRGKFLGFSNLLWVAGIIAASIGAALVGNAGRIGGQILFAHIGLVAAIVLVARLRIPESATWLAARADRHAGVPTIRAQRAAPTRLLRRPYLVPVLALIGFYTLVNLAANTNGQFGTYLLVNVAKVDVSTAALLGLVSIPVLIAGYLWFMRIADGPYRFSYFTAGGIVWVVGLLVPAVFGFSVTSYLVMGVLFALGSSFAFETIMKVWAQESFPTLIRSTAQGSIIAVARVAAAILAALTPGLIAVGPTVLYTLLSAVTFVGLAIAWIVFRHRNNHSEFAVEGNDSPTSAIPTQSVAVSSGPVRVP